MENMDAETINNHLNKLEEFVNDEDKIVTIPWLCMTLNINVKESKLLLEKALSNNRKTKPGSLAVTYILSGLVKSKPLILIVKDEELDDKKDLYTKEPLVQIYSLQKSKVIDLNTITLVDKFDIQNPTVSPIKGCIVSKNCIKREVKIKAVPVQPPSNVKEKPSLFSKVPPKSTKSTENLNTPSPKTNAKTSKANNFAQYFTKGENKNSNTSKTEKAANTNPPINGKLEEVKQEIKNSLKNLVDSDDDEEVVIKQSQPTSKSNKNVKRKSAKKNTPNSKRRKRIVVEDESDEDIFANDDDEEEQEENIARKRKNLIVDSEEDEPITKPEPVLAPKNKKRKLVDKTFQDEEGYVITKKEWVEESGSEEDVTERSVVKIEKEAVKQEIKKETDNKLSRSNSDLSKSEKAVNGKASTAKGKKAVPANQPTLMNFFKKK